MSPALLTEWSLDPSLVAWMLGLVGIYLLGALKEAASGTVDPHRRTRRVSFAISIGLLIFGLMSPLDTLSDEYLFTAHMLQHLILLLYAPPLLLWGMPGWIFEQTLRLPAIGQVLRWLSTPLLTLVLYLGLMWIWHAPFLFNLALENETIHFFEHACFFGSGLLFWWPITRADQHPRPFSELVAIVYLFFAALGSTGLAALLTFSATVLYPTYQTAEAVAFQHALGLTPLTDQETGGLLMWLGGAFWFTATGLTIFYRWFEGDSEQENGHSQAAEILHAPHTHQA